MAPDSLLPDIDLTAIQQADIKQAYWMLFQHMQRDFLTKRDFELIMATATAPPSGGYKLVMVPNGYATGKALAGAYKAAAETGQSVREGIVTGAESVTEVG